MTDPTYELVAMLMMIEVPRGPEKYTLVMWNNVEKHSEKSKQHPTRVFISKTKNVNPCHAVLFLPTRLISIIYTKLTHWKFPYFSVT